MWPPGLSFIVGAKPCRFSSSTVDLVVPISPSSTPVANHSIFSPFFVVALSSAARFCCSQAAPKAGAVEKILNGNFGTGMALIFTGTGSVGETTSTLSQTFSVDAGTAPLANAEAHVRLYGGPADRILLATNKYGSHATVKTLSRNSQVAQFVLPGAVSVTKAEGTPNKVATLIRSMPNTWSDADGDFEASTDETKKVWDLALAITKDVGEGEDKKEARAIVVGDVGFLADDVIRAFRANAQFGYDAARWLSGDEDITGEVETEEDVKVQHTREEDWMWFLTAIGAVPTTVLMFGVLFIRLRRRRDR